jgi:predicted nucleotidyltransferase
MTKLSLPEDFEDFLVELVDAGADFVLIGGWAMAALGRPRATLDMDVLVRPTHENSKRVYVALLAFGAPVKMHGVDEATFATSGPAYRFGVKPLMVEVLTEISGVDFDDALAGAITLPIDGREVRVIGPEPLLRNKRAAGRHKDLEDVEWLEEVLLAGRAESDD